MQNDPIIKEDTHLNIAEQLKAFENVYSDIDKFHFHTTKDPFTRFLRDRRLLVALNYLQDKYKSENIKSWKVLVVCGGVGGEAIFFLNAGFTDVTVSDFSSNSIEIATKLDARLKATVMNAEELPIENNTFDLIVVQDGLHHLPRPSVGFTEMLRGAKKATIVIEPYNSLVGNLIGTEWEKHDDAINFVFRWDRNLVEQTVKSYLLSKYDTIKVYRIWDHSLFVIKLVKLLPEKQKLTGAKLIYSLLSIFNFAGNMMVSVVCK